MSAKNITITKHSELIKEDKTVNKEWEKLYEEAMSVLNPHDVSDKMWVGSVASASEMPGKPKIQRSVLM